MAQTLAQVQARLTLLYASYDQLAALPIHTYSAPQRSATKHRMKELREEILAWEAREIELEDDEDNDDDSNGGIALAVFGTPR